MNVTNRSAIIIFAMIAGAIWLGRQFYIGTIYKGYEAVNECVQFSKEVGQRFSSANTTELSDDERDLAAYRFCTTKEGWEFWRGYSASLAGAPESNEM